MPPFAANSICLTPIGVVRTLADDAVLEIDTRYADGLLGIATGDALLVLYWMHELPPAAREVLQAHPRGDRTRPLTGVFALRSPMRPNPIGVTEVQVAAIDGCRVTVRGLDAHDGSPILDVKIAMMRG